MWIPLLFLLAPLLVRGDDDWQGYGEVCLTEDKPLYDPSIFTQTPWYVIDMDLPAEQRWEEVGTIYGPKMKVALDVVKSMLNVLSGEGTWDMLVILLTDAHDKLNEPYRSEIKALASIAQIDIRELTILNMLYEIAKACTSLVAQGLDGKMYHGRNLDFGFMFNWNKNTHTWDLTSALKDLTVNLNFHKGGKLVFKGVTFAGHLGILTGMRPNAYTISTNTRFGSTLDGLFDFMLHGLGEKELLIYANRDMLMTCDTFEEAVKFIEKVPLIARGYFIMTGSKPGQGLVITRGYNGTDHEDWVDVKAGKWFSLETNYDWDQPVIFLDDRRAPGNDCMKRLGQYRADLAGIYQVLSSKPTLNKATVYTTVMSVNDGIVQTITRDCADPCWFV